uniref:BLTX821 n=1 Tax=Nephila pilipes TaxID=299642 RepID=A0A076L0Z7_NEPPI|nr:BLTX821 [Nephila pilipes]
MYARMKFNLDHSNIVAYN